MAAATAASDPVVTFYNCGKVGPLQGRWRSARQNLLKGQTARGQKGWSITGTWSKMVLGAQTDVAQ